MLDGSTNLFDELKQTVERIELLADPTLGEVRIGAAEAWMGTVVPAAIDRLARQNAGMVFRVLHANAPAELIGWLRARAIDVFVSRGHPAPEEDIDREALFDDPLVVVAGQGSPLFRGGVVNLTQLVNEAWCMPVEPHPIGILIAQAFQANGLSLPRVRVSCASMSLQASLAATGRYLTVMPMSYLRFRADKDSLRIVPVDLNVTSPPVYLATLKHRRISPAAKLFIETLRAVAKEAMESKE